MFPANHTPKVKSDPFHLSPVSQVYNQWKLLRTSGINVWHSDDIWTFNGRTAYNCTYMTGKQRISCEYTSSSLKRIVSRSYMCCCILFYRIKDLLLDIWRSTCEFFGVSASKSATTTVSLVPSIECPLIFSHPFAQTKVRTGRQQQTLLTTSICLWSTVSQPSQLYKVSGYPRGPTFFLPNLEVSTPDCALFFPLFSLLPLPSHLSTIENSDDIDTKTVPVPSQAAIESWSSPLGSEITHILAVWPLKCFCQ